MSLPQYSLFLFPDFCACTAGPHTSRPLCCYCSQMVFDQPWHRGQTSGSPFCLQGIETFLTACDDSGNTLICESSHIYNFFTILKSFPSQDNAVFLTRTRFCCLICVSITVYLPNWKRRWLISADFCPFSAIKIHYHISIGSGLMKRTSEAESKCCH